MTRLYLLTTTLLVLLISTTSFLFLERSVENELDALTISVVKDYRLAYELRSSEGVGELTSDAWKEFATKATPAAYPCGWRVWNLDWNQVIDESGETSLLSDQFPRLTDSQDTLHLEG